MYEVNEGNQNKNIHNVLKWFCMEPSIKYMCNFTCFLDPIFACNMQEDSKGDLNPPPPIEGPAINGDDQAVK